MDEELRQAARNLLIRYGGNAVQSPLTTIRGGIFGGGTDRLAAKP